MFRRCTSVICTSMLLCCLVLLSSCNSAPVTTNPTPTPGTTRTAASITPIPTSTPTSSPTSGISPEHFTSRVLLQGVGRPDDLVFDGSESALLFSDFYNGTISQVTLDGKVTVLLSGLAGPEGLIVLPDHTLIIAEQKTNRILALAPGAHAPTVLLTLPGIPGTASCKDGVDGIAWDMNTNTLIVPDSPTGDVYRMSLDGKHTLTLLASGIVRPVGAAVDNQGNIYVADECGGALWRIAPGGTTTRMSGFGMLDDVVIDPHGNLLVIDLLPSIHALIRINSITGKRETLASSGFIEPQGLLVDSHDDIFVSDDYANKIVEYLPA
jgi:SMP-30/Gluconolactonase/LRE-like region